MSKETKYRVGNMVVIKADCGQPKFARLRGEIDDISDTTMFGSGKPGAEYTICFFACMDALEWAKFTADCFDLSPDQEPLCENTYTLRP